MNDQKETEAEIDADPQGRLEALVRCGNCRHWEHKPVLDPYKLDSEAGVCHWAESAKLVACWAQHPTRMGASQASLGCLAFEPKPSNT